MILEERKRLAEVDLPIDVLSRHSRKREVNWAWAAVRATPRVVEAAACEGVSR